MFQIAEANKI